MKKFHALNASLKSLLFIAGLLLAVWLFLPWKQIGEAALLSASGRLPSPASLAYSRVDGAGSGFVVHNLEIRNLMGMVNVSFGTMTVVPGMTSIIPGMTPGCRLAFTDAVIGDIAVTPLKKIPGAALGSGQAGVSVSGQGVFLDELRSGGDLSMAGSLLVDPSTQKIVWADLAMDIKSEAFEDNLPSVASVTGLPLQQEGPGRWLLRRARGSE